LHIQRLSPEVLALRYQSLGGVGFQLALPPPAWKVLEEDFGVQAKIPKWGDICCTNGEIVGDNKIFF